jgi:hypothetical protein
VVGWDGRGVVTGRNGWVCARNVCDEVRGDGAGRKTSGWRPGKDARTTGRVKSALTAVGTDRVVRVAENEAAVGRTKAGPLKGRAPEPGAPIERPLTKGATVARGSGRYAPVPPKAAALAVVTPEANRALTGTNARPVLLMIVVLLIVVMLLTIVTRLTAALLHGLGSQ